MRGVILAAGDGGRLRPFTDGIPKVLMNFRDQPLIMYPMKAMAVAGICEIGVVVGYKASDIIESLKLWQPPGIRLDFIYNPEFDGENGVSVRAAREFVGTDDFVLSMGDHVIDLEVVKQIAGADPSPAMLAIDSMAWTDGQLSDATKVLVDRNGYLTDIGKRLEEWNAVDIGLFRFRPSVFDVFDMLYERHGSALELTSVMRYLLGQPYGVTTHDVRGLFWSDIDTEDDYYSADELFGRVKPSDTRR